MSAGNPGIHGVLENRSVRPDFQPVLDLDTEQIVGYEALARGPVGELHTPNELFAAAHRAERVAELDWLCRERAVEDARAAGVRSPLSLLVNAEPETLLADRDDPTRWGRFADLRCYCEVTERALTRTPGRLAAAIDQIRAQDWGVALDDVGADPATLALLPLLQPDIIKLDLGLLQDQPTGPGDVRVARVVDAALSQAADTGAAVIAEGVETERHLELARAYGVGYGQGYLLGRPGPLPQPLPDPRRSMPLIRRPIDRQLAPGPFSIVASAQQVRSLSAASVEEVARQLLAQAVTLVPAPAVLMTSPRVLTGPLLSLTTTLSDAASAIPLVGISGVPQPPLEVTPLAHGDPAGQDFAVAVVTAHFAAAVVARPTLHGDGRYDAALVLDRPTVLTVANSLLTRM